MFLLFGDRPFTPLSILGGASVLKAWFASDKAEYLTLSSTAITQFLDISGNGNHTDVQSTSTKRMTWTANQSNGLSAALADGGDEYILPTALHAIPDGNNTVFAVSKTTDTSTTQRIVHMRNVAGQVYSLNYSFAAANAMRFLNDGGGLNVVLATGTKTNLNILRGRRIGTTQAISMNGGAEVTANTATNGSSVSALTAAYISSADGSGTQCLAGTLCEVLIYNRSLTASEILQVEIYLANKWGTYHPNATWINAYSAWQQVLIRAWGINKDDAFTNTTANPFAAIYDPAAETTGALTSVTDRGRALNTATEATNPPVNTASGIGTANALLYNGTTTILNAGTDTTVDNIFDAGGCFIGVIKPTTAGENTSATDGGRIFDKGNTLAFLQDTSGSACALRFQRVFSVTPGDWVTTSREITLGAGNIVAITYNGASTANNPTIYVNSLTAKNVTQTLVPTLTLSTDGGSDLILGNNSLSSRTTNGYIGKMLFLKSVPTTAQLTSIFNFLATEYGVTLT